MAVLATSSTGLSRFLEDDNAGVALALHPANVDARIKELTASLNGPDRKARLTEIAEGIEDALRFDAGDARLYSLLGEVEFQRDDKDVAYRLFSRARQFSKTEIHALQRTLVHSIEQDRLAEAVNEIDTMLRRWPDRFDAVAPVLPQILSRPEGFQAVRDALAEDAPWRRNIFATLGREPAGIPLAEQLLLDLKDTKVPPQPGEIASIINGYIGQKQYESAYRFFLFTQSGEEAKLAGYVFNGQFAPVRTQKPFDWQFRDQSGVEITFGSRGGGAQTTGATVRFLNKPVKDVALQQYLQLPPGSYVLTLNASGRSLKLPKELFWSLGCAGSTPPLLKLGVPEGSYEKESLSAGFSIAATGCQMQLLKLNTALIAESWRYRYVGVLTMHDIKIERVDA